MRNRIFVVMLLCAVCSAEENAALPLPASGNVTLTLDEYNRLEELASRPPRPPDGPPLPYSIKHAGLKLRVEDESVVGTVQLDGEVFHKGVSKVPLATGMTVLDAHENGKGVPLEQENGTHTAMIAGPGEFSVDLETGIPLHIEAGRASFSLPAPAAGSVELSLEIPGDHTFAYLNSGLITSRRSEIGHTLIEATLVPGQPANIWWATRTAVAPVVPRETRFLAEEKTLVSISEAEMRVAVLADVTVVQGEPSKFEVVLPEGFEVTGVSGATVDSAETQSDVLTVRLNTPSVRSHEFLISMERPIVSSSNSTGSSSESNAADAPFVSFKGAQRESGEVLVEGAGTMEITAKEGGGLKRMDVREANQYLRSLAHYPPQAAFRYHRQAGETPTLGLSWVRFPDGGVLAAVAESATVTTLVTSEGKTLTEIKLIVKNQAQPFLKVALPAGVTILSAEVAGGPVKPVQGADGSRVPLLRAGFRPTSSYEVSFVFMHSGAPFAKKGGADLELPSMDIPINLLNWEVFLPEQYKVKDFGGDVIAASRVAAPFREEDAIRSAEMEYPAAGQDTFGPGEMGGVVLDPSGAVISNARVIVTAANGATRNAVTDDRGRWEMPGQASGRYTARVQMQGFQTGAFTLNYDGNQPSLYNFGLQVGAVTETVEVAAAAAQLLTQTAQVGGVITAREVNQLPIEGRNFTELVVMSPGAEAKQNRLPPPAPNMASANVVNLQKRVSGVLPVPIDVPRAGTSFSFVRPLVLDEETKVTFSYKSR